jgi:hypothetical protein
MPFHTVRDFRQVFAGVLQKMRSVAMGFESGVILILLVNEKTARLRLVPVHLIHGATGFLA